MFLKSCHFHLNSFKYSQSNSYKQLPWLYSLIIFSIVLTIFPPKCTFFDEGLVIGILPHLLIQEES